MPTAACRSRPVRTTGSPSVRSALDEGLRRLAAAARPRATAGGESIEDSVLRVERTEAAVPDGAADLVADLYRRLPEARITDILLEVDDATRFTEAFTHLRTGELCRDRIGLLNVLAEGINLGLRKMAEATTTHGFWELMRIAVGTWKATRSTERWPSSSRPRPRYRWPPSWGSGRTASSDGQFFPAGGRGEALNLVTARYGAEPGVKAYSHVSDRFSPFATQTIPATVHEAPYILDGLLMNETGRRVREQYADTGGFTDHVFAACSILGYAFVPRIRDLPSKRLYVFERAGGPKRVRPLVGGKVNVDLIDRNWADILRVAATMAAGTMRPSQLLRKLAAYPRQNELASALREVGRIERSLFMIDGPRRAPARPGRLEQGRGASTRPPANDPTPVAARLVDVADGQAAPRDPSTRGAKQAAMVGAHVRGGSPPSGTPPPSRRRRRRRGSAARRCVAGEAAGAVRLGRPVRHERPAALLWHRELGRRQRRRARVHPHSLFGLLHRSRIVQRVRDQLVELLQPVGCEPQHLRPPAHDLLHRHDLCVPLRGRFAGRHRVRLAGHEGVPASPRREPVELLADVARPLLGRGQQPGLVERP